MYSRQEGVSICRECHAAPYNSLKVQTLSAYWSAQIAGAIGLTFAFTVPTRAQGVPSEPIVFGDGHVTVGADVSATVSCAETPETGSCGKDTGFFNYSDYEYSTLR